MDDIIIMTDDEQQGMIIFFGYLNPLELRILASCWIKQC